MECPLGAEILVPPFLYPSYSPFSRGGFVLTVKVIVLVPAGPTPGTFIQCLERSATKRDTVVGVCMDFFNPHCQWTYDLLRLVCILRELSLVVAAPMTEDAIDH